MPTRSHNKRQEEKSESDVVQVIEVKKKKQRVNEDYLDPDGSDDDYYGEDDDYDDEYGEADDDRLEEIEMMTGMSIELLGRIEEAEGLRGQPSVYKDISKHLRDSMGPHGTSHART